MPEPAPTVPPKALQVNSTPSTTTKPPCEIKKLSWLHQNPRKWIGSRKTESGNGGSVLGKGEPTPMRELSCAGKKSTWEIGGTPPRHVLQGGDNVCFALLNGVRRKLSNSKEWFLVCASAGMHVCM